MRVERLDRLCIGVPELEKGKELFMKILGLDFQFSGSVDLPDGKSANMALSNQGIELLEVPDREIHLRSFHFKVADIEEAADHVRKNDIDIISEFSVGDMDEKVMDLFGMRGILIEYPGDDPAKAARGHVTIQK